MDEILNKENIPTDHKTPDFNNVSKTHDWKNYVPDQWGEIWDEFTEREQKIISIICEEMADKEEWN